MPVRLFSLTANIPMTRSGSCRPDNLSRLRRSLGRSDRAMTGWLRVAACVVALSACGYPPLEQFDGSIRG